MNDARPKRQPLIFEVDTGTDDAKVAMNADTGRFGRFVLDMLTCAAKEPT